MNFRKGVFYLAVLFLGFLVIYQQQSKISIKAQPTSQNQIDRELKIEVLGLIDGETINRRTLLLRGETAANAEVFVGGNELRADNQGNFSTTLNLDEGENILVIVVNDDDGNYLEKELTVRLETFTP